LPGENGWLSSELIKTLQQVVLDGVSIRW